MSFSFSGVDRRGRVSVKAALASAAEADAPDSRTAFLAKLKRQREEREANRRTAATVLRLQAAYRGAALRKVLSARLRAEFDAVLVGGDREAIAAQTPRLAYFFQPQLDLQRLAQLAQCLLGLRGSGGLGAVRGRRGLLRAAASALAATATDATAALGPPLRLVEEFGLSDESSLQTLLLSGNLLRSLARALRTRVPTSAVEMETPSTRPPTPLASALVETLGRALESSASLPFAAAAPLLRAFVPDLLASGDAVLAAYALPAIASRLGSAPAKGRPVFEALLRACLSETSEEGAAPSLSAHLPPEVHVARLASGLLTAASAAPSLIREESAVLLLSVLGASLPSLVADPDLEVQKALAASALDSPALVEAVLEGATQPGASAAQILALASVVTAGVGLRPGGELHLTTRLAHRPDFIRGLWTALSRMRAGTTSTVSLSASPLILSRLQNCEEVASADRDAFAPLFATFSALAASLLTALDDRDYYDAPEDRPPATLMPFAKSELVWVSAVYRDVALSLIQRSFPESVERRGALSAEYRAVAQGLQGYADLLRARAEASLWLHLFQSVVRLLGLLHELDARLGFCPEDFWCKHKHANIARLNLLRSGMRSAVELFSVKPSMTREELEATKGSVLSHAELRSLTVLREIPFVVPFLERVEILHHVIRNDRNELGIRHDFHQGGFIHVTARRDHIVEDAMDALSPLNAPSLKPPLQVSLRNWAGAEEAGIDGGGLGREFMDQLLKAGFDPQRGFFTETPERLLYPNPLAQALYPDAYQRHFHFLGRCLGKLIYEQQLVELRFAPFFLAQLKGSTALSQLHHLKSLDKTLYASLCQLKTTTSNVEEMALDFSILQEQLGQIRRVELKPGGAAIPVTRENRMEYVQALADWYLRRQFAEATAAFSQGLADVVDPDWLGLFAPSELQILISGKDAPLDVEDMQAHTKYAGGFGPDHPAIQAFWTVLRSLSPPRQAKFLAFVTACSRPPLRGFRDLQPPLTIMMVQDLSRLPTAATCMNFLKLPAIADVHHLRERIVMAIESGAGFELS